MIRPECDSEHIVKNGVKENGKQNHLRRICDRQFVENPSDHHLISEAKRASVAQVPERWPRYHVNDLYDNVPRKLTLPPEEKGRLTVECDEMRSFVGNKDNRQWIRLAIDRDTTPCQRHAVFFKKKRKSHRGDSVLYSPLQRIISSELKSSFRCRTTPTEAFVVWNEGKAHDTCGFIFRVPSCRSIFSAVYT